MLGPALDQRRPAGPGEAAGDAAGAVDLADRNLARVFGIDPAAIVAVGGEGAASRALKLEVHRIDDVLQGIDGLDRAVLMGDVDGLVALETGLRPLVLADAGLAEIFDVLVIGLLEERGRVHQDVDLDLAREIILILAHGRRGTLAPGLLGQLQRQLLELIVAQLAGVVGERCILHARVGLEEERIDQLVEHRRHQDHREHDGHAAARLGCEEGADVHGHGSRRRTAMGAANGQVPAAPGAPGGLSGSMTTCANR